MSQFPTITITLEGMRQTIQHAFIEHLVEQDLAVQAALKKAIEAFDIEAVIRQEIESQFPYVLRDVIGQALRSAIWKNDKLRDDLTRKLAQFLATNLVIRST